MKMPWSNLTGLARTTTVAAFSFLVSSGLCGLNLLAVYRFANRSGSAILGAIIPLTGALELLAMATSAVFLIGCGIAFIIRAITRAFDKAEPEE